MELLYCTVYVAAIGILSNIVGNALPRCWFRADAFPFRSYAWERGGKVYQKLHIRAWKDRVPDMSRIIRKMYRKEVSASPNAENLQRLIEETCVAEAVHAILILLSLYVVKIWKGAAGWIIWGLCILGNLPFIIIQRYNRPRFLKTLNRLRAKL